MCRLQSGLQKIGYSKDEVNTLFEELDWNHSQSITRDEWISFRVNKNLALAHGNGRGFKPRKGNVVYNPGHPISEVQTVSCEFSRTASSTFTTAVKNPAKLAMGTKKVLATTHAQRHLVCSGQKVSAKNQGATSHPAPPSAPAMACERTCAAVAGDDVWNEAFILLLTRSYNSCFKLIRMRRDELIPRLNATDNDRNTLLHACALSLNRRHRMSVSLDQNLADTEEDDGAPKMMPAALPKIIKYLLDMGIEIQKNSQGQTPADALKANNINQREIDEVFGVQLDENDGEDKDSLFPLSSESGVGVPALKTVLRKGQARRVSLGSLFESQPSRHMPPVSVSQAVDWERGERRQSGTM